MSKEEETQEFMLKFFDARMDIEVDRNKELADKLAKANAYIKLLEDKLEEERAIVKGLQDHANEIDDFEIAVIDALDKRTIN